MDKLHETFGINKYKYNVSRQYLHETFLYFQHW